MKIKVSYSAAGYGSAAESELDNSLSGNQVLIKLFIQQSLPAPSG